MNPKLSILRSILVVTVCIVSPSALGAADPVIHLQWDGGGTPEEVRDYILKTASPASPEFPDVELRTGHLDWRIWSTDTDNPGGVGEIGVISSPAAATFTVRIATPADSAGARNVKGISLIPTGLANYSNFEGGISGDLEGDSVLTTHIFGVMG